MTMIMSMVMVKIIIMMMSMVMVKMIMMISTQVGTVGNSGTTLVPHLHSGADTTTAKSSTNVTITNITIKTIISIIVPYYDR